MNLRSISDGFIAKNSQQKIVDNPTAVILNVRTLTNSAPDLTELILNLIISREFRISGGEEKHQVEEFVRSHIIEDWQSNAGADYFKPLENKILSDPEKSKILLKLYSILGSEDVLADGSAEIQMLLNASLVRNQENIVYIHNPIYGAIFSRAWITQSLDDLSRQSVSLVQEISSKAQSVPVLKKSSPTNLNRRVIGSAAAGLLVLATLFTCQNWSSESDVASTEDSGQVDVAVEPSVVTSELAQQMSFGEKTLISKEEIEDENAGFRAAKASGVSAIAAENYSNAVGYFEEALSYYKNAPETLIYLNNARIDANGSGRSYTLAAAVPISDDLPAAQGMLRGVAQAQNKINENGGINGVPLKVVIVNDAGDAKTAPQLAETIAKNGDILGVVGHYYSSVTLSAEETYEQAKLAIIALSSSVDISKINNNYVFRTSPSDAVTGKALANYALNVWGTNRVAVFYNSENSYSSSLKSEFEDYILAEQGEVVADLDWSQKNFNPKQAFEQAVEQGAELLMVVPTDFEALQKNVFPIAQRNFVAAEPLKLMGGDVAYSSTVLEEEFEGMVVGAFWHIGSVDPQSEFIQQSQQLWNAEVNGTDLSRIKQLA